MGYFETFYVQREENGVKRYCTKTIDIDRVESWEFVDNNHVGVFMRSGDKYILHIPFRRFSDIVLDTQDVYGRLLTFNPN